MAKPFPFESPLRYTLHMGKLSQVFLSPEEMSYHVEAIALQIPGKCGKSLKMLRENAGYSQTQVGSAFHRSPSAVASWESEKSWPPKNLTARVLQFLQVSPETLATLCNVPLNADLSPTVYATGDTVAIEYQFFLTKRGAVLQAVTNRAEEGSDNAAKLFLEWMRENEKTYNSRSETPQNVTDSALAWTQKSLTDMRSKRTKDVSEPGIIPAELAPQPTDNT